MLAGDGDFGLLFVVHFEHVAGFEPGNNFLNVVDVDEVGAMRAPKNVGVERGVHLFERAVVGSAIGFARADGDEPVSDGGENQILGIHEKQTLLRFDEQFDRRRRRGGLGGCKLTNEFFEALGGAGVRFHFAARAGDGFGDARFVERL